MSQAAETYNPMAHPLVKRMAELLPQNAVVLDAGAGAGGNNSHYLAECGHRVHCMDSDEGAVWEAVVLAEAVGGLALANTSYVKASVTHPPYKPVFDAVVCDKVLAYISQEDEALARGAITKLQHLTKPGGLHLLNTFIGPAADQRRVPTRTLLLPGELRRRYELSGWDILSYSEDHRPLTQHSIHTNRLSMNSHAAILARKPSAPERSGVISSYRLPNGDTVYPSHPYRF